MLGKMLGSFQRASGGNMRRSTEVYSSAVRHGYYRDLTALYVCVSDAELRSATELCTEGPYLMR